MLTHASTTPLDTDRWYRSTLCFEPGVPIRKGETAVLERRIEIRYFVMKITEKRLWFEKLEWIQSFMLGEPIQIEHVDARNGIVLTAYAVTNRETITLDECNYLFEAMHTLPNERHFPKTQLCAIMISISIFEDMEAELGCAPLDE